LRASWRPRAQDLPGAGIALAYNSVTGHLIVTGARSRSASRGNDYTTIAYHG